MPSEIQIDILWRWCLDQSIAAGWPYAAAEAAADRTVWLRIHT
jgi:hypothetical protein